MTIAASIGSNTFFYMMFTRSLLSPFSHSFPSSRYSGGLWRNAAPLGPLTAAQANLKKLKMGVGNGDPRGVGGLFHLDQYISSLGKFCLTYSLDLETDEKTQAVVR